MKGAFILLVIVGCVRSHDAGFFLGCYEHARSAKYAGEVSGSSNCTRSCADLHFIYASLRQDKQCMCLNVLGKELSNNSTCKECLPCQETFSGDIYITNAWVPGPPRDFRVENVTSSSVHISYKEPESHLDIVSYEISATVLHTYSKNHHDLKYTYSNDTFRTPIVLLQPATTYNFSCQAVSPTNTGVAAFQVVQMKLADPDVPPPAPDIIERHGHLMTVKINQVDNNNGPVSAYRLVMLNMDSIQIFQPDTLANYETAKRNGVSHYITAEIPVQASSEKFTIGDGKNYRSYYNAPLDPSVNYDVIVGVVSELNGDVRVLYSDVVSKTRSYNSGTGFNSSELPNSVSNLTIIHPPREFFLGNNERDGPSGVVIGLSVAIGFLCFVLVITVVGFLILRKRISSRRMRLTDNQELTMQGPMIEIENSGYIPEEERGAISYYDKLQEKVRTIPKQFLSIDEMVVLGYGKYGMVCVGKNNVHELHQRVAVYSVRDRNLDSQNKYHMLKDLDVLVKCGNHENVIALIGTSETPEVVNVVLEYVEMDLKEFLLKSRDVLAFSSLSGHDALQVALNVAKGMGYLEKNKIVHRKLCARNVLITADKLPKVGGFGIAQYYDKNKVPDCTRWMATEIFQGVVHTHKSDAWSFACLLWEICALGGTPYGNVLSNNEIPERIKRGLRLSQMKYVSDGLYQIMLDCWQTDLDERPSFSAITDMINAFGESQLSLYSNCELSSSMLKHEPYYPELELTANIL